MKKVLLSTAIAFFATTATASDVILTKDDITFLEQYVQGLVEKIESYENQISNLEQAVIFQTDRADSAENELVLSQSEVIVLTSQVEALSGTVQALENANADLKNKVDVVEGLINDEVSDRMEMMKDVIINIREASE